MDMGRRLVFALKDASHGHKMGCHTPRRVQANMYGVKLILPLVGNWGAWEEKATYNEWAGNTDQDAFYTSAKTRGYYMDHVKTVLGRVNSLTNVAYAEVGTRQNPLPPPLHIQPPFM